MRQSVTNSNSSILSHMSEYYKRYKCTKLNKLISDNKYSPPQGSAEWLSIRGYNIGGSEMSVITGDNPYMKIDQLVAQKIGLNSFEGNIATRWGKLFEHLTQSITEKILPVVDSIKETGSLPGVVQSQRYSPDGLAVVIIQCTQMIDKKMVDIPQYCIVLFEYKSPLMSIPNETIPKHYLPQVKTGLCSIPISDFAIFINNMFRKCKLVDLLDNPNYDTKFHSSDIKKKYKPDNPLAIGVLIFSQTDYQKKQFCEKYIDLYDTPCSDLTNEGDSDRDSDTDVFDNIKYGSITQKPTLYQHIYNQGFVVKTEKSSIDFGDCTYTMFNDLLNIIDDNLISVEYCDPYIFNKYKENTFLSAQNITINNKYASLSDYHIYINNKMSNSLGYLPWKLMKSNIICEFRDPNYVKKYEHIINDTINKIIEINKNKTELERISAFRKHYPKSNILKKYDIDKSYVLNFLPSE